MLAGCATAPPTPMPVTQKSLIVGTIEQAVDRGSPDEMGAPAGVYFAGVMDWRVRVEKVLSGVDPGSFVDVRITAGANPLGGFEGETVVVLMDPDLKLFVPGQSWWTSVRELACVPQDWVRGETFDADGFEWDGKKCVDL